MHDDLGCQYVGRLCVWLALPQAWDMGQRQGGGLHGTQQLAPAGSRLSVQHANCNDCRDVAPVQRGLQGRGDRQTDL